MEMEIEMEYLFRATKARTRVGKKEREKEKGRGKRSKAVKLSREPQSVAARQRRHRISERLKVLQSMVPGGSKMDIASMLEETIHYVKFLKTLIWLHHHHHHQTTLMLMLPNHPPPLFAPSLYSHTNLVPHQSQAPLSPPSLPLLPPDSCFIPQLDIPFDYEPPIN